ncbi:MAG TPA: hypothetical protein VNM22_05235 [Candidatus Limnocylindrales bacterium]|nr:hypothetical protein [Candidatus Limnocylindrales bacterium]
MEDASAETGVPTTFQQREKYKELYRPGMLRFIFLEEHPLFTQVDRIYHETLSMG